MLIHSRNPSVVNNMQPFCCICLNPWNFDIGGEGGTQ